jgi:hypothetical protein
MAGFHTSPAALPPGEVSSRIIAPSIQTVAPRALRR